MWLSDGSAVNMHPSILLDYPALSAIGNSVILATDGIVHGGYGSGVPTAQHDTAIRWSGSPESAEFLFAPFSSVTSRVNGVGDSQQVGFATPAIVVSGARGTRKTIAGSAHALLWLTGSTTAIDLHNGADTTVAMACSGGKQVGYGATTDSFGVVSGQKAMMWFGNRNNFIWLHPNSGFTTSEALAISGGQQVGFGTINSKMSAVNHALLWTGSAASATDLHPDGFLHSFALGCGNGLQVGYATDLAAVNHAFLWTGGPETGFDLNSFLPTGYSGAVATGIDSTGRISGYAYTPSGTHAIAWVPAQ
jgi:hypothetical protein